MGAGDLALSQGVNLSPRIHFVCVKVLDFTTRAMPTVTITGTHPNYITSDSKFWEVVGLEGKDVVQIASRQKLVYAKTSKSSMM